MINDRESSRKCKLLAKLEQIKVLYLQLPKERQCLRAIAMRWHRPHGGASSR